MDKKEYFVLFSMDDISETQRKALEKKGILYFDLGGLLKR